MVDLTPQEREVPIFQFKEDQDRYFRLREEHEPLHGNYLTVTTFTGREAKFFVTRHFEHQLGKFLERNPKIVSLKDIEVRAVEKPHEKYPNYKWYEYMFATTPCKHDWRVEYLPDLVDKYTCIRCGKISVELTQ